MIAATGALSALDLKVAAMKTICACGFDCSDFVAHHAIPGGARFSCPTCELTLSAAQEPSPDAYMDVNGPGTQALPRFAAEGPSG